MNLPLSFRYSVLIIGFRSLRFLDECFGSIKKTYGPSFEILFLDNNSPEPEADWINAHFQDPHVRVFHSTRNLFFAGGVNYLAERAHGEFLVLLNPDTHVDASWLDILDRYLNATGYEAANMDLRDTRTPQKPGDKGFRLDPWGLVHHIPGDDPDVGPFLSGGGGGMAIKRSVFFDVGAMDEDFRMYFEEVDLCWRANLYGYRIGYVPGSIIYHVGGGSSSKTFFLWNRFRGRRNRIWSFFKNAGPLLLAIFIPLHLILCAISVIGNTLIGKFRKALAECAAVIAAYFFLSTALSKRTLIQKKRKVRDSELMKKGFIVLRFKRLFHHN